MKTHYNTIVIGSGIAGMTAAIYLKRSGLDVLIIEENAPGGQLNKITDIENYPGFLKISGPDLAMNIYSQVNDLKIEYLFEAVISTDLTSEKKVITTTNNTITCDYLIIATGKKNKQLFQIDDKYLGKGISYCALCDGNLYRGKDVAVVGGGNSALEEALYLSDICQNVTIILRGDKFRGEDYLIERLKCKKNIKIMYHTNITAYNIENDHLVSVSLDNSLNLMISGLFISIGSLPRTNLFSVAKENDYILINKDGETSEKNVYACGDVVKKEVYQLTTAAAEGTMVAYKIIKKYQNNK